MATAHPDLGVEPHESSLLSRVEAAAAAVVDSPSQVERVRLFDRTPVPMAMVDGGRRYVEANRPARLVFRLSQEELQRHTIDDLTAPRALPIVKAAWARLRSHGRVAGRYEAVGPDVSSVEVAYCALAYALPGLHLFAFAPVGWLEEKLTVFEGGGSDLAAPPTSRERVVLQLAAEGLSSPRIAERLAVSPSTVTREFKSLYQKLGVGSRAAAVARGVRLGLID